MQMSQFSHKLQCQHCAKTHATQKWPMNGDRIPFYFQKTGGGNYTLEVTCPHCRKSWYIVWDDNPGTICDILPNYS